MTYHAPAGSEQMRAHRRRMASRKLRLLGLAAPALLKAANSAILDYEAGDDVSEDTLERTYLELKAAVAKAKGAQ